MMEQFAILAERIDQLQEKTTTLTARDLLLLRHSIDEMHRDIGATLGSLVEHVAAASPPRLSEGGPLVSIVLVVRNRPHLLPRAVASVVAQTYPYWELVVVDDGSEIPVSDVLSLDDSRVRLLRIEPSGASAARNRGLQECSGELVTFIDSDNWWFPRRLEGAVGALPPGTAWGFDQQVVLSTSSPPQHVRDTARPLSELAGGNFIDLGAIIVDREFLEGLPSPDGSASVGTPFDESLRRFSDWDLVLRLADAATPARIPLIGQVYDGTRADRISSAEPWGPAFHTIRRRVIGQPATGLRILLAEWHFPQVTETYIQADIAGLRALGAEVEVWSDEGVAVTYEPGVPWRRGDLADHIADFRPDLVLSHWLHVGLKHREVTRPLGIPHAVRCHGFDYDEGTIAALTGDPGVAVHLFDHMLGDFAGHPNVTSHPVGFDPQRISPTEHKDRRLVVRLSAGLHTKDLDTFLLTAARCPGFRFVLGIGHSYNAEHKTDELIERARELGPSVEVVTDLGYREAAELTMRAGIYLHTHGEDHRLGMPISPIEAMASGALVLARSLNGSEYLGAGALRYDGADAGARADHAAALVNATLTWTDDRWAEQRRLALDASWVRHPADLVVHGLLATWADRFGLAVGELSRPTLPSGAR